MSQPKTRNMLIDLCRGILILMMTARHTISILEISPAHWLYKYFLPKGWATVCFISLSGFSIGMLFLKRMRDPAAQAQTSSRLRNRGWQLMVVMFLSNLFMTVSEVVVRGEMDTLTDVSWWLGLITLKTPYSISSILIPTALLVFIAPSVLKTINRYTVLPVLGVTLILALVTAVIIINIPDLDGLHYLLRRLLFENDGYFPILPMVLYGIISIAIGTMWDAHLMLVMVITSILYYGTTFLYPRSAVARIVFGAVNGPARLVIVNFISLLLLKPALMRPVTDFFSTIGRFSLLSFLLHRIFLNVLIVAIGILQLQVSVELLFFVIVALNLVGIWLICAGRLRYLKLDVFLKKMYL